MTPLRPLQRVKLLNRQKVVSRATICTTPFVIKPKNIREATIGMRRMVFENKETLTHKWPDEMIVKFVV